MAKPPPPLYAVLDDTDAETLKVICCTCKDVIQLNYYQDNHPKFSYCPYCGTKFQGEFTRKNPRYHCPKRKYKSQQRTKLIARITSHTKWGSIWFDDHTLVDDLVFEDFDRAELLQTIRSFKESNAKFELVRINPPNNAITIPVFKERGDSPCQPSSPSPISTTTTSTKTETFWSRLRVKLTGPSRKS